MSLASNPFFSICIATYSAEKTLRACLDSIFLQSELSYEVVVVDGGSPDGTLEILDEYGARIRFLSEPDRGITDAWNKAISMATGKWIYFLGADDCLASPDVLSSVRPFLERQDACVAYADVIYINEDGESIARYGQEWDRSRFCSSGMTFCHQGVFHERSIFEEYGKFNLDFRICADYEMLLRYLKQNDAAYMRDIVVALVQYGGLSTQDKNAYKVLNEYIRAQTLHGIKQRSLHFYRAYIGALLKAWLVLMLGEKHAAKFIDSLRPFANRPQRT